ncbi:hypothetical protein NDU88_007224 [Pleurodeles waltl]|uniref:Uncharacterized protein n=1 Tax=Pleurodeles waltl TaxID=8319 RepID=A0AAV7N3G7_PLEWA|nr:hypothetical protein NDU88_007224 [Pleurodeles waltl]
MRPVQATLPERQRPGNPLLVLPVGYAMACSHVSTALRRGPSGTDRARSQGPVPDSAQGPTLHSPTGQAGLTPFPGPQVSFIGGLRSSLAPSWCAQYLSRTARSADAGPRGPLGPAAASLMSGRPARSSSVLWDSQEGPKHPGVLAPPCQGQFWGLQAQRRPHGQPEPGVHSGRHTGHNATLPGPAGAGQARLACCPRQAVLTPYQGGPRARAAAPPGRSVTWCCHAVAGQT